jgi:hypothetical protein
MLTLSRLSPVHLDNLWDFYYASALCSEVSLLHDVDNLYHKQQHRQLNIRSE